MSKLEGIKKQQGMLSKKIAEDKKIIDRYDRSISELRADRNEVKARMKANEKKHRALSRAIQSELTAGNWK